MNENKLFHPLDIFEFIHHLEYGCRDLKGLSKQYLTYVDVSIPCNNVNF